MANRCFSLSDLGWLERQSDAIVAIAKPGRCWAVREHVSLVANAAGTVILCPGHPEFVVFLEAQRSWDVVIKARPAGATVIFCGAFEQREITACTVENAFALFFV